MQLVAKPHPFTQYQKHVGEIPEGASIAQIVDGIDCDPVIKDFFVVQINGRIIPKSAWHYTFPKETAHVTVVAIPKGGDGNKGALAAIAMIALVFAAPWAAGQIGGLLNLTEAAVKGLKAGITLIGSLIIGALFKPPTPESYGGQSFTFAGQSNQIRRNQGVMSIYGKNKVYPDVIASPFTIATGKYDDLYMLLGFGYGYVDVQDIRVDNTPISNYEGVELRIHQDWVSADGLEIYPNDVDFQDFSVVLEQDVEDLPTPIDPVHITEWFELETVDDTDKAILEIAFPSGLIEAIANSEDYRATDVKFALQFRELDSGGSPLTSWIGFLNLDHSYSEGWSGGDNGKGVRDYETGTNTSGHELSYSWNDDTTIYYNITDDCGEKIVKAYKYAGSTQIGINTNAAVSAGSTMTINGVLYTILDELPASSKVLASISPALQNDVFLGTYHYCMASQRCCLPNEENYWDGTDVQIISPQDSDVNCFFQVNKRTSIPFTVGVSMTFPSRGRYELRIARYTWYEEGHEYTSDTTVVRNLKSVTIEPPIDTDDPMTIMELKIRASKQLNGTLDDVNAICERHIDVYENGTWNRQPSSTPAWVFTDVASGVSNKKPVDRDEKIDLPKLVEWAEFTDKIVELSELTHKFDDAVYDRIEAVGDGDYKHYFLDVGASEIPVTLSGHIAAEESIFLNGERYIIMPTGDENLGYPFSGDTLVKISPNLKKELLLGIDYGNGFVGDDVVTKNEEPYLSCNFVFAGASTTVDQMLDQVAASGKATRSKRDDKYSVVFDKQKSTPAQIFTQRNSYNFNMEMRFIDQPHGIRCHFRDKLHDWEENEIIAYMDGYDRHTVEEFNPDPWFENSLLPDPNWIGQTGWSVTGLESDPDGFGYAEIDGSNTSSSNLYADIVEPLKLKVGIRYLVSFEIFDYQQGSVRAVVMGRGVSDYYEENGYFEVYVPADGFVQRIYIQAQAGTKLKVRKISVSVLGATNIEDITLPMCTSPQTAWRLGRYYLAEGILRPETYYFYADVENLAVERGDRALIAHDAPSAGGVVTRIVAIESSGDTLILTCDETFYWESEKTYTVTIRTENNGAIYTTSASEYEGNAFRLIIQEPTEEGIVIDVHNLLVFGETEKITADFLISEIRPATNLAARIGCVPYAPEIYDADTGVIPVYKPLITGNNRNVLPVPVSNLTGSYYFSGRGDTLELYFVISWEITSESNLDSFEVWHISKETGQWEVLAENIKNTTVTVQPVTKVVDIWDDYVEQSACFAVVAVNYNKHGIPANSSPSTCIYVYDPYKSYPPPPDVTGFVAETSDDEITFLWNPVEVEDLSHYEIRFFPEGLLEKDAGMTWGAPYLTTFQEIRQVNDDPYFSALYVEDAWVLSDTTNMKMRNNSLIVSGGQSVEVSAKKDFDGQVSGESGDSVWWLEFNLISCTAGNVQVGTSSTQYSTPGRYKLYSGTDYYSGDFRDITFRFSSDFVGVVSEVRAYLVGVYGSSVIIDYNNDKWNFSNRMAREIPKHQTSLTVPLRKGHYLIKAYNIKKVASVNAATAIVSDPSIYQDMFLFQRFTRWSTRTSDITTNISVHSDYGKELTGNEGYIIYDGKLADPMVALDAVYEVDITQIPVVSYLRDAFIDEDYELIEGNVEIQVSYSAYKFTLGDIASGNPIEDLGDLTSLDPLGTFTEWKTFTRGKFVGRFFKFRAKLTKPTLYSYRLNADPVFDYPLSTATGDTWHVHPDGGLAYFDGCNGSPLVIDKPINGGTSAPIDWVHFGKNLYDYTNKSVIKGKAYRYKIIIDSWEPDPLAVVKSFYVTFFGFGYGEDPSNCSYATDGVLYDKAGEFEGKIEIPANFESSYGIFIGFAFYWGAIGQISRFELWDDDPKTSGVILYDADISLRVAKYIASGQNAATNTGTTTGTQLRIYYSNTFIKEPVVTAQVSNPTAGYIYTVNVFAVEKDYFQAIVYEDSGSGFVAVNSEIDWIATGFGKETDPKEVM